MKKIRTVLAFALMSTFTMQTAAAQSVITVSDRTIVAVGGHNHHPDRATGDTFDSIMEFTVDGSPFGSQFGCSDSNYVRWNMKEDTNAYPMLSIIMTALATGKKVNFAVSGCAVGRGVKLVHLTLSK